MALGAGASCLPHLASEVREHARLEVAVGPVVAGAQRAHHDVLRGRLGDAQYLAVEVLQHDTDDTRSLGPTAASSCEPPGVTAQVAFPRDGRVTYCRGKQWKAHTASAVWKPAGAGKWSSSSAL